MKMRIIFGIALMAAATLAMAQDRVEVRRAGTLSSLLTERQKENCTSLAVSGKLNSADIRVLRQMAGYTDEGGKGGKLEYIDLKEVEFVSDKTPFMTLDAAAEHLAGTALPGKVKWYEEAVDRPPLVSQRTDYNSYRSWNWHWRYERMDESVMWLRGETVLYYRPRFFLGHDSREAINLSAMVMRNEGFRHGGIGGRSNIVSRNSDGQYFFARGMGPELWKEMKKRRITRFKGHRITVQDSVYCLSVSCVRGRFFHDTFYKCPRLRTVILPVWATVDYTLVDETSKVDYVRSSGTMVKIEYYNKDWRKNLRDHIADFIWSKGTRLPKCAAVNGEEAERLAGSLQGLKRIYGNNDIYFRMKMTVCREGSADEDIYYCDEYHIKHLNDGKCYATDERLLDELVAQKIMKPYK